MKKQVVKIFAPAAVAFALIIVPGACLHFRFVRASYNIQQYFRQADLAEISYDHVDSNEFLEYKLKHPHTCIDIKDFTTYYTAKIVNQQEIRELGNTISLVRSGDGYYLQRTRAHIVLSKNGDKIARLAILPFSDWSVDYLHVNDADKDDTQLFYIDHQLSRKLDAILKADGNFFK